MKRLLRAEALEDRRMLAGDGINPTLTLETTVGDITIELFPDEAPLTVANFLNYVNDGDLDQSIFHRLVPGFVIQGGGFTSSSTTLCEEPCDGRFVRRQPVCNVPTDAPVQNEFGISNVRATVAMAKLGGNPDSATSQFFINLSDNAGNLDNQNGGFTVFGCVVDMTVADEIAALPRDNVTEVFSAFTDVPYTQDGNVREVVRVNSISGTSVLGGTVFLDQNSNGALGSGEGGLADATVYVDENGNGKLDENELTATTDERGAFRIPVATGTHTVRVLDFNAEYEFTGSSDSISRTGGRGELVTGINFGFAYTGTDWHNVIDAANVDGVNGITPFDALLVINELSNRDISDAITGELPTLNSPPTNIAFLDVVENGIIAPLDALFVINNLPTSNNALIAPSSGQATAATTNTPAAPRGLELAFHGSVEDQEDLEGLDEASSLDQFYSQLGQ